MIALMTSSGSPYARFRRALEIGRLPMVRATAAELSKVGLADALAILELIAAQDPEHYPPAAARFLRRLGAERRLTLEQQRRALAALELLPAEPRTVSVLRRLV